MATFGLGAALAPRLFVLNESKHLIKYPKSIASCYMGWLPTAPFAKKLDDIARSSQFQALEELRNSLAHRGILPRQHYFSTNREIPSAIPVNPKALPEDLNYLLNLSDKTTSIYSRWLVDTLNILVRSFDEFLSIQTVSGGNA